MGYGMARVWVYGLCVTHGWVASHDLPVLHHSRRAACLLWVGRGEGGGGGKVGHLTFVSGLVVAGVH